VDQLEAHQSAIGYRAVSYRVLGGHLDECTRCGHRSSPSIPVEIATARSVRWALANAGWKSVAGNFFRRLTCMSFSPTSPLSSVGFAEQEGRLRSSVSTSAETLLEVARDPEHLGAEIGFFSVLHSWSQKLELIACTLRGPAGGLSADYLRWIKPRYDFFLPVEV